MTAVSLPTSPDPAELAEAVGPTYAHPVCVATRRARIAEIQAKIRRLLTPSEMRAMEDFETWSVFALLFAVVPEEPWYIQQVHRQLAAKLAKNIVDNGYLEMLHAEVLALVESLAWIADETHHPSTWPKRGHEVAR